MSWDCKTTSLDSQGLVDVLATAPPTSLTVGQKFGLICSGTPEKLDFKKLNIVSGTEMPGKYKLKLLYVEDLQDTSARMVVASYVVGPHKGENIVLADGTEAVPLAGLEWQIQSVLQGQQPPQEPYGPFGPLKIKYPMWFWIGIGFLALLLILTVVYRLRKYIQRRNLIKELDKHKSAKTPLEEFYAEIRKIEKKYLENTNYQKTTQIEKEFLDHLALAYKMFLVRAFRVPALLWNRRQVIAEFKKYHKDIYRSSGVEIVKAYFELEKAKKEGAFKEIDAEQLIKICRRTCECLWDDLSQRKTWRRKV